LGTRKTMTVALARKLLISLWRFATTGETLDAWPVVRDCRDPLIQQGDHVPRKWPKMEVKGCH
jgi:hypothetical protein